MWLNWSQGWGVNEKGVGLAGSAGGVGGHQREGGGAACSIRSLAVGVKWRQVYTSNISLRGETSLGVEGGGSGTALTRWSAADFSPS